MNQGLNLGVDKMFTLPDVQTRISQEVAISKAH